MAEGKTAPIKVVATHRQAAHEFTIHERFEAGIALTGSEVKSLRAAKATIVDGWVEIRGTEAWLHGVQINEYAQANRYNHQEKRPRKLLLNLAELKKIADRTTLRGYTCIPLQVYFKGALVKVEIALVSHKKAHDKRQSKREADDRREIDRVVKEHNRGRA